MGQMGNSEVGHLNLGAGFVVRQDVTLIDDAIADGSFFTNQVLCETISTVLQRGTPVSYTHLDVYKRQGYHYTNQ